MKVLLINSVCGYGSTGRICADLAQAVIGTGNEAKVAYGRKAQTPDSCKTLAVRIGTDLERDLHVVKTRLTDRHGLASAAATKRLIRWIEDYSPDVIHLHNLHGYYIHVELLFGFLKRYGKPVIWTLHDCWAFTGHCAYYDSIGCERWKYGCSNCPQSRTYPKSWWVDASKSNFQRKLHAFSGLEQMTLVTPSSWLKEQLRDSFLKDYPVKVIPNGVNTGVFYPRSASDIAKAMKGTLPPQIRSGRYLLGVANEWEPRKGLDDFLALAARGLGMPMVLIGLRHEQRRNLPDGVYGVERTDSPQTLAALYSGCTAYLNLTYEDNYPTTNLEAAACGAYVITYNTGGCAEMIAGHGSAVRAGDLDAVEALVQKLPLPVDKTEGAVVSLDRETCIQHYLALYDKNLTHDYMKTETK